MDFLTEVNDFELSLGSKSHLKLRLGSELQVQPIPAERRIQPVDPSQMMSLLWAAGGGAYLIADRYVPIVQRSLDAPTNPGKWTLSTGLASSYEELTHPILLIRELFEEVVLIKHGQILVPDFGSSSPFESQLSLLADHAIQEAVTSAGLGHFPRQRTQARLRTQSHIDQVTIKTPQSTSTYQGILHVQPERRNANLMFVVSLPEIHGIENLETRDTELPSAPRQTSIYDLEQRKHLRPDDRTWQFLNQASLTSHAQRWLDVVAST